MKTLSSYRSKPKGKDDEEERENTSAPKSNPNYSTRAVFVPTMVRRDYYANPKSKSKEKCSSSGVKPKGKSNSKDKVKADVGNLSLVGVVTPMKRLHLVLQSPRAGA